MIGIRASTGRATRCMQSPICPSKPSPFNNSSPCLPHLLPPTPPNPHTHHRTSPHPWNIPQRSPNPWSVVCVHSFSACMDTHAVCSHIKSGHVRQCWWRTPQTIMCQLLTCARLDMIALSQSAINVIILMSATPIVHQPLEARHPHRGLAMTSSCEKATRSNSTTRQLQRINYS